ncbi:MAG: InlB B-repeat-containing protein [Clostridia bacterium]|nr:InlB B-repeat-containing protein [Clostridia bacterium]
MNSKTKLLSLLLCLVAAFALCFATACLSDEDAEISDSTESTDSIDSAESTESTESGDASDSTSEVVTYTITFANYDGTVLQSGEVAENETPVYDGETPVKAADAQYTYTFNGWAPEIVAATEDVTYTATYTETVNNYTVTFDTNGGNEIAAASVPYGTASSALDEIIPTKTGYTFEKWQLQTGEDTYVDIDGTETVAENITVKAVWTANTYYATFKNGEETVGEPIAYTVETESITEPAVPAKEGYTGAWETYDLTTVGGITVNAVYTLIVYTATIDRVVGDDEEVEFTIENRATVLAGITLTADTDEWDYSWAEDLPEVLALNNTQVFTETRAKKTYTITWKDGDGNTLDTDEVAYGEVPAYTGETPTKAGYDYYAWTLDGELYNGEAITSDAVISARWYKGIFTPEEFLAISGSSDNYILMRDIDFSGVSYTRIHPFSGILEGNGYTVRNITLPNVGPEVHPMFGDINGTVRDLTVEITVNANNGMLGNFGIFANSVYGKLENVRVCGTLHGKTAIDPYTGWGLRAGIVASEINNGAIIKNVVIDVVTDEGTDVNLVAGYGTYTLGNCFIVKHEHDPNAIGGNYTAAGWIGLNTFEAMKPHMVSAFDNYGAYWTVGETSVSLNANCVANTAADISNYTVEYYLEGEQDGVYAVDGSRTLARVARMGATVEITPTAIDGYTFDSENANNVLSATAGVNTVLKLYYNRIRTVDIVVNNVNGSQNYAATLNAGDVFSASALTYPSGYDTAAFYNGSTIWKPGAVNADITLTVHFYKGVSTAADFMAITGSDNYILLNDINFSGVEYTPIASFSGTLEGNGYAVKNVTMQAVSAACGEATSLFKNLSGTLLNIKFENIVLNATNDGDCGGTGLIASYFTGTVDNVYLTGTMHGTCKTTTPTSAGVEAEGTWAGLCFGYSSAAAHVNSILIDVVTDEECNLFIISGLAWHTVGQYVFAVSHGRGSFAAGAIDWNGGWQGVASMEGLVPNMNALPAAFASPAWTVDTTNYTVTPNAGYLV